MIAKTVEATCEGEAKGLVLFGDEDGRRWGGGDEFEFFFDLTDRGIACLWSFFKHTQDDMFEVWGDFPGEDTRRLRRFFEVSHRYGKGCGSLKGGLSGKEFVDNDAQGVDISALVEGMAQELFGGHIERGAEDLSGIGEAGHVDFAGDAKVHDDGVEASPDQDVFWFEVTVDDAFAVGFFQST